MAIDFNLLNAQGSLPDFLPKAPQGGGSSGGGGGGLSEAEAAKLNLAYGQDQRQAQLDAVRLAREQQAMGIDANSDARAERKTNADISNQTNLTNAQVSHYNEDTKIKWATFADDHDIKYKDFDLRKQQQAFSQDLATQRFGLEKAESGQRMSLLDKASNREDLKFDWQKQMDVREAERKENKDMFDVDKWKWELGKNEELKTQIQGAMKQGPAEVANVLIGNGNIAQAGQYLQVIGMQNEVSSKQEQAAKQQTFPIAFQYYAGGKEPNPQFDNDFLNLTLGKDVADAIPDDMKHQAAQVSFYKEFGADMKNIGSDPNAAAALQASNSFGTGYHPPLTQEQVNKKSEFLSNAAAEISQGQELYQKLSRMKEIAAKHPDLIGQFGNQLGFAADVGSSLEAGVSAVGFDVGNNLRKADADIEEYNLLATQAAGFLSAKNSNGTAQENARLAKYYHDSLLTGEQAINSIAEQYNPQRLEANYASMAAINKFAPGLSAAEVQQKANELNKKRIQVEQKIGRPLESSELNEFLNIEARKIR